MRALNSHAYAADCVCPTCAGHRADGKLAVIDDFINWANAPLRAGMLRFVDSRPDADGIDVPIALLRKAGLPYRHIASGVKTLRMMGYARA
jgi:hypothetical protein